MIGRSLPDLLIDNIVTALRALSTEQAAEDAAVAFKVGRDVVRPVDAADLPFVNVWLDNLEPQGANSSGRLYYQDLVTINVDLFTKGLDTDCDGLDDTTAMSRLYYLAEQTRHGLYALTQADFNLVVGKIGRKRWPRFQLFQNELKMPESEIVGGRWTLEIEYSWMPEDVAGETLQQIAVDASLWAAQYNY
jgi:hypothetical protein